PGYTIGVGPVDVGLEKPVTYFRFPTGVNFEPIAIADTRDSLNAVGHEFYHQLGYFHASPGCGPVDLYNLWPPDQKGYIEGVGLNRTKVPDTSTGIWDGRYAVFTPGTSDPDGKIIQYYDFMSYCGKAIGPAWISVKNWNSFGGP